MNLSCKWVGRAIAPVVAGFLAAGAAFADSPAAPAQSASGVWQKHEYTFQYFGFTTTFSCDGLADKLKILLIAAGARADVKATEGPCVTGYGRPDKFARANLTFYTLAPDSAAALADAKRIDGTWRPVHFAPYSPRELRLGDCEVVDQFVTSVLPMFTTRNLDNHTVCVPRQESGSDINLKMDVFVPAPVTAARNQ